MRGDGCPSPKLGSCGNTDPEAESAGFDKMTSLLAIHLKDGRVISGRAEFAKGSPLNPMTFEDVEAKFRGCAEFADWPREKADQLIGFVTSLDSTPQVDRLMTLLSRETTSSAKGKETALSKAVEHHEYS